MNYSHSKAARVLLGMLMDSILGEGKAWHAMNTLILTV